MKIILTEKVAHLGNTGDIVNVASGYGRNYLIPQQLGMIANDANQKELANHQKRLASKVAAERGEAEGIKKQIEGLTIDLIKKVGNNGKLFGSVTNTELASELKKLKDIDLERRLIVIDTPIKAMGTFEVKAKLFTEVVATFNVKVTMDPAQAIEMKKREEAIAARKAQAKLDAAAKEAGEAGEEAPVEGEAEVTTEETEA